MFETIAVLVVLLLGALLVFAKARERLKSPGARRSRDDGGHGDGSGNRHHDNGSDGGDGGGGD